MIATAFVAPVYLILLAIPLAAAAWFLISRPAASLPVRSVLPVRVDTRTWRLRLWALPEILRALCLACLVLALAGPLVDRQSPEIVRSGLDVMLLLDVSQSMGALDFEPDRLGAARRFADGLLTTQAGDRFGVMTFATRTRTICPLTTDLEAVRAALQQVEVEASPGDARTALAAGVVNAVTRLQAGRSPASPNPLVVLLSDGGATEEAITPDQAAAVASQAGVRVYAVEVGGTEPAPYPTELGILRVPFPVNERSLRTIAESTGGRYVRIENDAAWSMLSRDIRRQERPAPVVGGRIERVNAFPVCVLAALLLLIVELVLRTGYLARYP